MIIEYRKIAEEASWTGISKFLLVKRKLIYGYKMNNGMCKNCEFSCLPKFKGEERLQCTLVGVGDDFYADVNPKYSCKKGFKLR